jgi:mannan endo-1,6-alpha-mannosidase
MNASEVFFVNNVMTEVACESNGKCDVDQQSFKGYLARWMAATTKVAPFTSDWVMPKLQTSAKAAVGTCTAGNNQNQCGLKWTQAGNDGLTGVGEQLAALEIVQANLVGGSSAPVTNSTGGTSKGNPAAGSNSNNNAVNYNAITGGDKAGAGILTTLILIALFGGAWWMASTGK